MTNIYISRVVIQNFRNFIDVDINTESKQVIFGENESGKTNYLYALQLILDPSLSDEDRFLSLKDFNVTINNPIESKSEIIISLYLSNFEDSKTILAQLSDAVVNLNNKRFIKLTYKYYAEVTELNSIEYKYIIFKGDDEKNTFTSRDRRYIQLKVIKPLRDVEYELRNSRRSPLIRLLEQYDIQTEKLNLISNEMYLQSQKLLDIDEINDLQTKIEKKLIQVIGEKSAISVSFAMADIDPNKILYAIKILLSDRLLEEKSLGIKNVLYIMLLLLQFHSDIVPMLIKEREFIKYIDKDSSSLLMESYKKTSEGNYIFFNMDKYNDLATFFTKNQRIGKPEVIIAIEEPEAHLHPILQRLVFKDVIFNNNNSIILTTHSTHISSISPINYMVHTYKKDNNSSQISVFHGLHLSIKEKRDVERYLDITRGEVYFGKGSILVEGIAEEYLIPQFADLLGESLDQNGIVVCSVNSTNFYPYVMFLKKMNIPYVIITDGDFYYEDDDGNRNYHIIENTTDERKSGYLGLENISKLLAKFGVLAEQTYTEQSLRLLAEENNIFIGKYTFEVDIFLKSLLIPDSLDGIIESYNDISEGGERQKSNFKNELIAGEVYKCLNKIETNGIGKVRFAQRFSSQCKAENIPDYVKKAIKKIITDCDSNE